MIYWAPLLHFYQPPLQIPHVLRKVVDESYRPLIEVISQHPNARVTVNINGVLTEMLAEGGYQDVIDGLRQLADQGQVEFVGSGKYHPILPLIPVEEMRRQIRRNFLTNRHFFGAGYRPRGFFPPELAYSRDIVPPILESQHEWVIVSGVACAAVWPVDVIHELREGEDSLAVFFRDDILSNKISFQGIDGQGFVEHLRERGNADEDQYVVTAMDAETFGHHIQNWENLFLAEVYERLEPDAAPTLALTQSLPLAEGHRGLFRMPEERQVLGEVGIVTLSDLLDRFPRGQVVEPHSSSWSTSEGDIKAGNPYPLWKDPGNHIHRLQWDHVRLAISLVRGAEELADTASSRRHADIARTLLDEGLHSCQFWWASKRPMWDVNMVSRGLSQQTEAILNAFRAINLSGAPEESKRKFYYQVVAARDIRDKINDRLFWD